MAYLCLKCHSPVDLDRQGATVRCDRCGSRILLKQQPTTVRRLKGL